MYKKYTTTVTKMFSSKVIIKYLNKGYTMLLKNLEMLKFVSFSVAVNFFILITVYVVADFLGYTN